MSKAKKLAKLNQRHTDFYSINKQRPKIDKLDKETRNLMGAFLKRPRHAKTD